MSKFPASECALHAAAFLITPNMFFETRHDSSLNRVNDPGRSAFHTIQSQQRTAGVGRTVPMSRILDFDLAELSSQRFQKDSEEVEVLARAARQKTARNHSTVKDELWPGMRTEHEEISSVLDLVRRRKPAQEFRDVGFRGSVKPEQLPQSPSSIGSASG